MSNHPLRRRASIGFAAAITVLLLVPWAGGISSADPAGHAAKRRAHQISGTANFHLVRKSGSTLYESGTATGSLPGRVSGRFVTGLTKVTGTVTFYPSSGGSLTITAVGYPQSASTITRFTGNLAVRSGTGRYRSALGSGTLTGTANRRTWAITVHATATVTY